MNGATGDRSNHSRQRKQNTHPYHRKPVPILVENSSGLEPPCTTGTSGGTCYDKGGRFCLNVFLSDGDPNPNTVRVPSLCWRLIVSLKQLGHEVVHGA